MRINTTHSHASPIDPAELPAHLLEHGRTAAQILAIGLPDSDVRGAMRVRGLPLTSPDADALTLWHVTAHELGDAAMQ